MLMIIVRLSPLNHILSDYRPSVPRAHTGPQLSSTEFLAELRSTNIPLMQQPHMPVRCIHRQPTVTYPLCTMRLVKANPASFMYLPRVVLDLVHPRLLSGISYAPLNRTYP